MRSLLSTFVTQYWSRSAYLASIHKKEELKLLNTGHPRQVHVFLALDDPYSFLLLQVMPGFKIRFDLKLTYHLIHNRQPDMFPEPERWRYWAIDDAQALAEIYQLDLPNTYPSLQIIQQCQKRWCLHSNISTAQALDIFQEAWHTHADSNTLQHPPEINPPTDTPAAISQSEKTLKSLKGYLPATIFYAGDTYWGIDRLEHLELRLIKKTAGQNALTERSSLSTHQSKIEFNRHYAQFCQHSPESVIDKTTPIVFYFSMRSPYSYLALIRLTQLSEHYQIPLKIKPVLPMIMRGLKVPRNKVRYIFFDTLREAKKYGIPYGKVADPLGKGVINCYALWEWAEQQGKGVLFLNAFSTAVNAEGIRADTQAGLKLICERCELNYDDACLQLTSDSWKKWAKQNQSDLYDAGMWGVPTIQYKNTLVWGQDRIWRIEQALLDDQP